MAKTVNRWSKFMQLISNYARTRNTDSVKLIGQDHLGNRYFEAKRPNHSRPNQRFFNKSNELTNFKELVEAVHVPPAWDAWLRFRRQEPPSEQEVLESEEYFTMQQERAQSCEKPDPDKVKGLNADKKIPSRRIPPGAFRKM